MDNIEIHHFDVQISKSYRRLKNMEYNHNGSAVFRKLRSAFPSMNFLSSVDVAEKIIVIQILKQLGRPKTYSI